MYLNATPIVPHSRSRYAPAMTNKTIGRADIAGALHKESGLSQTDCLKLLEGVLNEITNALVAGEKVKINNFATFKPHQKPERVGRNPKTLEEVPISPRKVVMFRPSGVMKGRINGGRGLTKMLVSATRLSITFIFITLLTISNPGWGGELASYVVYLDGRPVLRVVDGPGTLTSTALPLPGSKPVNHPFLSASALDPSEEGRLRVILDASLSTSGFLDKLKQAGYEARREVVAKQPASN